MLLSERCLGRSDSSPSPFTRGITTTPVSNPERPSASRGNTSNAAAASHNQLPPTFGLDQTRFCQFVDGQNAQSLGLSGSEVFHITGLDDGAARIAKVIARRGDGSDIRFDVEVLLLTPMEVEYFRHGGILHYVLRQLAAS